MKFAKQYALLVLLVPASLLSSCIGSDKLKWKEEVWTYDNRVIIVDRESMRAKSGLPTSVRGPIKTEELRYEPLKIKWHSEKGAYEVPIAFDVIEGVPFLVTVLSIERERYCKQNPDRSYVANFYTWKDEEIVPIQSDSVPLYRMRNNLSGLGPWGKYKQGDRTYLSIRDIAQKSVRNADGSPAPLDVYFAKKKMFKCK